MTADQYARRVDSALRDLPWPQRRDLVAEIRQHLAELPDGTDIEARLGHPERYAADLRTAAGLKRQRGPAAFLRARRPRTLILAAVALALLGLGIGGVVWVDSYQPLGLGTGARYPRTAKEGIGAQAKVDHYRPGKPFEVGVSLVNSGRFTVRITGAEPWGPLLGPSRLYMAGPQPGITGGFPQLRQPFHAFDLAPGQEAFVSFKGVYRARCHPAPSGGTAWGVGGVEVQYSFLWRTGRAEIPLPEPLLMDPPRNEDCTRHGFSG